MLQLSIENISMKFDELHQLKANNWKQMDPHDKKVEHCRFCMLHLKPCTNTGQIKQAAAYSTDVKNMKWSSYQINFTVKDKQCSRKNHLGYDLYYVSDIFLRQTCFCELNNGTVLICLIILNV